MQALTGVPDSFCKLSLYRHVYVLDIVAKGKLAGFNIDKDSVKPLCYPLGVLLRVGSDRDRLDRGAFAGPVH